MTLLDEDRMTRMRANVMSEVDAATNQRRRTLRRRIGAGGVAAVLAIGAVSVGQATDLTGGGSESTMSSADSSADMEMGREDLAGASDSGAVAPESTEQFDGADSDSNLALTDVVEAEPRDVIVTGDVQLEADDPSAAVKEIAGYAQSLNGRVENQQTSESERRFGSVTVRLPSDQTTEFVDRLSDFGAVISVSLASDDVTTVTRDLDARIEALDISIDRLEAILSASTSTSQVFEAETALTERQSEREQLVSQRADLSEQISMSTLLIEVHSDASEAAQVDPGGFQGGLTDGWNSVVNVFNSVLRGVGVALPWIAVLTVLGGLAWLGRRIVRTRATR